MANRSYLNPEDEIEGELTPDSSLSNRSSLPSVPSPGSPDPVVKDYLMQQYLKEQGDADQFRTAKMQADTNANLGLAFSQIAQGANAPKESGVFKNIAAQNEELLGSKEKDVERRRRVMEAIEGRKAREALEKGRRDDRQAQLSSQREDRKLARDVSQQKFDQVRGDKLEREAKLDPKQAQDIQEFDDSIATMKSVMSQLGNHSDWTGPVDGRMPDLMVGADQVAFRSELGRMVDKYRKLITGAGASNQELKKLEGRLPQPGDSYSNFMAKANNFLTEVERSRGNHLKNLSAQGKNVKPFEGMSAQQEHDASPNSKKIIVSNGKETLQIDPSDLADAEKDGYTRM